MFKLHIDFGSSVLWTFVVKFTATFSRHLSKKKQVAEMVYILNSPMALASLLVPRLLNEKVNR